jgi:hypothetical protein
VAARLPSVFAVAATALLLAGIARRLFDRRVAWWAALIFLSGGKILWQGRIGQIDMLLVAMVTAAMYCFVRGLTERAAGLLPTLLPLRRSRDARQGTRRAAAAASRDRRLGAALRRASRAARDADRPRPADLAGRGPRLAVPAAVEGGRDYFETIVFRQNLRRYADPWHHLKPWYYYLTVIPADFFPWSLFLPGAIWIGWKRIFGPARRGVTLALSWIVVTLIFFSLSPAKRTVYILTMYPAMALLVAAAFSEIEASWPRLRRFVTVPAALGALLAVVATASGVALVRWWPERVARPLAELAPMGPGCCRCCSPSASRWRRLPARLAAGASRPDLAVRADGRRRHGPGGDRRVDARAAALRRRQVGKADGREAGGGRPAGEPWAIWPHLDATFLFHTRRRAVELATVDDLYAFARRPERVWLLITRNSLAELSQPLPMTEVARDADARQGFVLLVSSP